jgi:hypothetical protein
MEYNTGYEGLIELERLVGKWIVSGPDIEGVTEYEWLDGSLFLLQKYSFVQYGQNIKGIEIIGYEKPFGVETPGEHLKSRVYDNMGNTLEYTYEVDVKYLIIWAGDIGSQAFFKGEWNEDFTINTGAWVYPGGGGYESTMTKIK